MTRLYYDCPILALYMMKEFDVRIQNDMVLKEQIIKLVNGQRLSKTNYPVRPESEHIFEPKEGDFGFSGLIQIFDINYKQAILLRDGKQFFSPEEEDD